MSEEKKKLMIIDSQALIHRAYHALPPLETKQGEVVGAVYGFLLVFFKAIKDLRPDFVAAAFDLPKPTFRHEKFEDYKAQRPEVPEDLTSQIPKVKDFLKAFRVPFFEVEGFEADDILGTVSKLMKKEHPEVEVFIVSGDLDTLQLVNSSTKVYTLRKGVKDTVVYDKEAVKDRYELEPGQVVDYKALKGDPSDNIPGVPQVGKKTATKLLKEFNSLENLYENFEESEEIKERIKKKLRENKEQAEFSKSLIQIRYDVPLDFNLSECEWDNYEKEEVIKKLKEFEFHTLIDRLPELEGKDDKEEENPNLKMW